VKLQFLINIIKAINKQIKSLQQIQILTGKKKQLIHQIQIIQIIKLKTLKMKNQKLQILNLG
jgi:hypothetical protein